MTQPLPDSITLIDCHYLDQPQTAAAYLIRQGDRLAFVDNNNIHALPRLLSAIENQGLTPAHVDYLILTHIHLDHSGCTHALAAECPQATIIAHPRAKPHLADPAKLIAGTRAVYGPEAFDQLYGTIDPLDERRIQTVDDGETLDWHGRPLQFLHTRGHANHHISLHDPHTRSVFSGDAYGVGRVGPDRDEKPFVICSSAPTDFDAEAAHASVDRLVALKPERILQAHFGPITAIEQGARQLHESIDCMEAIRCQALQTDLTGQALEDFCRRRVEQAILDHARREHPADAEALLQRFGVIDVRLNAKGLAFAVEKARYKAAQAQKTPDR